METPAFRIGVPDWLNGIRHWGHKVTEEMEAEEPGGRPAAGTARRYFRPAACPAGACRPGHHAGAGTGIPAPGFL